MKKVSQIAIPFYTETHLKNEQSTINYPRNSVILFICFGSNILNLFLGDEYISKSSSLIGKSQIYIVDLLILYFTAISEIVITFIGSFFMLQR